MFNTGVCQTSSLCRLIGLVILASSGSPLTADDRLQFFEKHIRPALIEHCYECHSNEHGKSEGGLLLDSRPAIQRGGETGPLILAGQPDESLLVEALKYESYEMPPDKQLDDATIRLFEEWIRQGAVDPRENETMPVKESGMDFDSAGDFWAFQPRKNVSVPQLKEDWGSSPIDRFIFEALGEQQLQPAAQADRATWLRRVTYDLVGLPPSVEELDDFLADKRPDAYARVVDRLLASPQYGERWGRYWLDLARYADSNGADENHDYPVAWRYRDYIVSAYNADKPYDRMIHEQLAGDLLPAENEAERRDNLTATGFLVLGPKMLAEQDKEKMVADIVDEQLDTTGKVFLGLTLGCARCHDHKFDPISANDYYAMAGVFHSTRTMEHLNFVSKWSERELPDRERQQEIEAKKIPLGLAQAHIQKLRDSVFTRQLEILSQLLLEEVGVTGAQQRHNVEEAVDGLVSEDRLAPLRDFRADGEGAFRVWNKLTRRSEAEFVEEAKKQWQAMAKGIADEQSTDVSNRFELRLVRQPVPANKVELVSNYLAAFRQARKDIEDSADDSGLRRVLFSEKEGVFSTQRESIYLTSAEKSLLKDSQEQVETLKRATPELDKVMAAQEYPVRLVALHVRGSHLHMSGDPLPRAVPQVLQSSVVQPDFPSDSSGRLELAQWLTHPDHPLTARVMVNRIWQGHFGQGLVQSSSNFGIRGDLPTHPELLDWLASEFVRGNWSIKRMHRFIVLSATYRLSSSADSQADLVDPENRFLSHFPRLRLELEPIRDSLLAIAGQLDSQLGGTAGAKPDDEKTGGKKRKGLAFDSPRRTIYLSVNRAALEPVFSTFDYIDPAVSLEKRPSTIVPHQILFLMNHPLVMDAAEKLSGKVVAAYGNFDERIEFVYKIMLSRLPTADERLIAEDFITKRILAPASQNSNTESAAWASFCRSLLLTSEYLYVE